MDKKRTKLSLSSFLVGAGGFDGLCPSFASKLANSRLCSPSARGGSNPLYLLFKQKEKQTSYWMSAFLGGSGWIRTTEGIASRFTVCPLWPLGNSPILNWSWWTDLNPRPADYKSAALPTELHQRIFNA